MNPKASKINASTQKFTEIVDIVDNIVVLQGGNAALVVEVTASNFALLSKKEQDAKIYSYASLLNSLTHPIQILIRNKRVDVSSYLKLLDEHQRQTQNPQLATHIAMYRDFIHQMVRVNVVLNKSFYIVIPYSALEGGATAVAQTKGTQGQDAAVATAKKALQTKADSLLSQLRKISSSAKILEKEELVKLFYDIYNADNLETSQLDSDIKIPIVKAQI
jgi:hypothetical protein